MSKEILYLTTRRWFYKKFDQLIVTVYQNKINLSKQDDKSNFVRIYMYDDEILVYYYFGFKDHLTNIIPLETSDFELFLVEWIEDKFNIKIDNLYESDHS